MSRIFPAKELSRARAHIRVAGEPENAGHPGHPGQPRISPANSNPKTKGTTVIAPHERDVCQRAQELIGSPWKLAEQITFFLKQKPSPKNALEICALRLGLAKMFAADHNWKLSPSPFDIHVLAKQGVWGMRQMERSIHIDHAYYFRTSDRRAAGLAVHLYDNINTHKQQEIRQWAGKNKLNAEYPTDFPSWWVPGSTTLVLYRPLKNHKQDR